MASFSNSNVYRWQLTAPRGRAVMRRLEAIFFAVLLVILAAAMIVKSNKRWDGNAEHLMKTLTPDVLVERCGLPASDLALGPTAVNRQIYYPISRDNSIGLTFTFLKSPGKPKWTYSSFHLGTRKGEGFAKIDTEGSETWAIVELPCLSPNR